MFSPVLRGDPKLITIIPMALLNKSSETPLTPKAARNVLLQSDTLPKLTRLSLHSASSQTLLESSSDQNTFTMNRNNKSLGETETAR